MINQKRAITKFMEVARISSVSKNERGVADYLTEHFKELGYEVVEDLKSKAAVPDATVGNIIVKVPGKGKLAKEPAIILATHMDTVEPGDDVKPQLTDDGQRVVSDGTTILGADDKGAIAQVLELIQVLREDKLDHPPLELVFAICEELGLLGARALDTSLITAKNVYVIDGSYDVGDVLVAAPTMYNGYATIYGKAAHAGVEPDKGISSIQVLAKAINNIKLLKVDDETSCNIGYVETLYPLNVVPEITKFGFEVRSLNADKAEKQLQSIYDAVEQAAEELGARVEWDVNKVLTAHHITRDTPLLKHYYQVCETNGIQVNEKVGRGGSDLSAFIEHGLEGIVLPTASGAAHTLQEYLDIPIFMRCTKLLIKLVTTPMDV